MIFKLTDIQNKALPLVLSTVYSFLYGGSRSGKTFLYIMIIVLRALSRRSRHAVLRFRFSHIKQSVVYDTFPKVCSLLGASYSLNKTDWVATFENGSEIWFGGLDEKDRTDKILGNEYSTIFLNEVSQISFNSYQVVLTRLAENVFRTNRLFCDANPPSKAHWIYRLFILGEDPADRTSVDMSKYSSMLMNPSDNLDNLPDNYIELLEGLSLRQRLKFLEGKFADIVEGALWTDLLIGTHRVSSSPDLVKIVIGVDPAITSGDRSDETGIIVCGICADGYSYVLNDSSGIYTPKQWSDVCISLYYEYEADYIIIEKNQGGDMVRHTIESSDAKVPIKAVHAFKGKILRAEPISVFYENGKIKHVGIYPDLEQEMVTFTGSKSDSSPNRLDALVYSLTELMIGKRNIFFR